MTKREYLDNSTIVAEKPRDSVLRGPHPDMYAALHALIFSLIFLLSISISYANPQSIAWFSHDATQVNINVDLFLSSTCPHCQKADAFFHDIEKKKPWLHVSRYVINQDKSALHTFYEHLQQQHSDNFSVPAIFFCDARWVGFFDENTTGKALLHALTFCRQKISEQGELSLATINVVRQWGSASQFQMDEKMTQSTGLLIPLSALTDAFNPCSLFCFAALLAFLWMYPTQKWQQFSVGIIFVFTLGIIHYVQQVYSAIYFQTILNLRLLTVVVGMLLLLFIFHYVRNMMRRTIVKPGLLVFVVIILTVFAVQTYQQICAFNVSLVVEQWLAEQTLSSPMHLFYQLMYQVFYLLPLLLFLVLYLLFGRGLRIVRYQQMLQIAACVILASIGVILIICPPLLTKLMFSSIVLVGAILLGWLGRVYI